MFLDDIADAVSDVVKPVAEGVSHVAEEAFSTVLSPAENLVMKGLGGAASTVSDLFGGVDLFDSALGAAGAIAKVGIAGPLLGAQLLASEMGVTKGAGAVLGTFGLGTAAELFGDKAQPNYQLEKQQAKENLELDMLRQKKEDEQKQIKAKRHEEEMKSRLLEPKGGMFEMLETAREKMQPQQGKRHEEVQLNPQPLPPGPPDEISQGRRHEEVQLNPQPLPPGPPDEIRQGRRHEEVMLNPQPLPPGPPDEIRQSSRHEEVMLNPQPLPPGPPDLPELGQMDMAVMKPEVERAAQTTRFNSNVQARVNFRLDAASTAKLRQQRAQLLR